MGDGSNGEKHKDSKTAAEVTLNDRSHFTVASGKNQRKRLKSYKNGFRNMPRKEIDRYENGKSVVLEGTGYRNTLLIFQNI